MAESCPLPGEVATPRKRPLPPSPTREDGTPRKTLREEVSTECSPSRAGRVEEGGWRMVGGTRPKQPSPQVRSPQRGLPSQAQQPKIFKVVGHVHDNMYKAVRVLEEAHPTLALSVRRNGKGEYLLSPKDRRSQDILLQEAGRRNHGITLEAQDVAERTFKAVLMRFPVNLPLDPILEHPLVTSATRCTYKAGQGRREPTRQVFVSLKTKLPPALDLGAWGEYSLREYVPEPTRCFKCQRFGHIASRCRSGTPTCGVCSGDHPSRDCIERYRNEEEQPPAQCPNCKQGHHAWNRRCPERLARLPQVGRGATTQAAAAGKTQTRWVPASTPTHSAWRKPREQSQGAQRSSRGNDGRGSQPQAQRLHSKQQGGVYVTPMRRRNPPKGKTPTKPLRQPARETPVRTAQTKTPAPRKPETPHRDERRQRSPEAEERRGSGGDSISLDFLEAILLEFSRMMQSCCGLQLSTETNYRAIATMVQNVRYRIAMAEEKSPAPQRQPRSQRRIVYEEDDHQEARESRDVSPINRLLTQES